MDQYEKDSRPLLEWVHLLALTRQQYKWSDFYRILTNRESRFRLKYHPRAVVASRALTGCEISSSLNMSTLETRVSLPGEWIIFQRREVLGPQFLPFWRHPKWFHSVRGVGIGIPKWRESKQARLRFIILERQQSTRSSLGVPRAPMSPSMSLVV